MARGKAKKPKRSRRDHPPRPRAFTGREYIKEPWVDRSALRDNLEGMLLLAWVVFLFGFFVMAPVVVRGRYGPGWGFLIALLGFPIWGTVGIRPMPGLLNGFICILGYTIILCSVFEATLEFLISFFR